MRECFTLSRFLKKLKKQLYVFKKYMTFTTDLSIFFSDFVDTATIGINNFSVILDRNYVAIDAGESYISSYEISALAKQSDINSYATIGASITIDSVVYKIVDIKKMDDHRIGQLILQEV